MTRKAKRIAKQLSAKGYSRNEINKIIEFAQNSIFTYDYVLQAAKPVTTLDRAFIKCYKHKERYWYLNGFGFMNKDKWVKLILCIDPVKRINYLLAEAQNMIFKYALLQSDEELKEFLGIKPAVLIKFKHEVEQRMKGLEGVKILETESETFYQEINGIRVCKK